MIVVVATLAVANVNNIDSATTPPTPQHETDQLPTLEPTTLIAHHYTTTFTIDSDYCSKTDRITWTGSITIADIGAPAGVTFVPATVTFDWNDWDDTTSIIDSSSIAPHVLDGIVGFTECDLGSSGDYAGSAQGDLSNGDTFYIEFVVP
ncbi:MAG: hypothetical protein GY708_00695 [Actinomycetia bacterium]|nr:hypothetical protein [Actinomycetes bacterium]